MPLVEVAAVVFDCDGTLVDSERVSQRAWEQALAPFGLSVEPPDRGEMVGHPYAHVHAHFAAKAGVSPSSRPPLPDAATFWTAYSWILFALIDRDLAPFADAIDAVRALHRRGVPVAVASGSGRERLDRTLAGAGVRDLFEVTVAGDEVARPKPAPDGFLLAAERLGVAPAACLSVEDSAPGVAAARAAGMRTVAVARAPEDRARLTAADLVLDRVDAELLLAARAIARDERAQRDS